MISQHLQRWRRSRGPVCFSPVVFFLLAKFFFLRGQAAPARMLASYPMTVLLPREASLPQDTCSDFPRLFPSLPPLRSCHPELPGGCQWLPTVVRLSSLTYLFHFSVLSLCALRDLLIFVTQVVWFSRPSLEGFRFFCFPKSSTDYVLSGSLAFPQSQLLSLYGSKTLTPIWGHQCEVLKITGFNIEINFVFINFNRFVLVLIFLGCWFLFT